jgi:energy-coupling factor transporter ATP-binding protein EcfA2
LSNGSDLVTASAIAAKFTVDLVQELSKQGVFDRIIARFKDQKCILVLGSSGVGKSQLVQTIKTYLPDVIDRMDRTQANELHRLVFDKEVFRVIDTPGQEGHQAIRGEAIKEAMSRGTAAIVNVVCYGYHEGRVDAAQALTPEGTVRPEWLEMCRSLELANLKEWAHLFDEPILLAINKADVWWDQRDTVLKYYSNGPYAEAIKSANRPAARHREICSVVHNYFGKVGHAALFDDAERVRVRAAFMRELFIACLGKLPDAK